MSVCGRTYTNRDDVSSIVWINMCEPCYENYQFNQEVKEELQKYKETINNIELQKNERIEDEGFM